MAQALRNTNEAESKYFLSMKAGLLAHVSGYPPVIAVEFAARRSCPKIAPASPKSIAQRPISRLPSRGWTLTFILRSICHVASAGLDHRQEGQKSRTRPSCGAWKIAYADFVTAMMAFFLLLWLINMTTPEQKEGLANYFAPPNISESTSGSGGAMGGRAMDDQAR